MQLFSNFLLTKSAECGIIKGGGLHRVLAARQFAQKFSTILYKITKIEHSAKYTKKRRTFLEVRRFA